MLGFAAFGLSFPDLVIGAAAIGYVVSLIKDWRPIRTLRTENRDLRQELEKAQKTIADDGKKIEALEAKVADLEKKTDYEVYAERSARDHKAILDAVNEQTRQLHANTVALEFLIKQAFPTASFTVTPSAEETV